MTYLLLQTFLLLLASYFLGAFVACTVKRALFGSRGDVPAHELAPAQADVAGGPPVVIPPQPVRPRPAQPMMPPVTPRTIDPVQPKIEVLRRPEPRPAPAVLDPSRFERALTGPHFNEGVPRISIIEICPAVLPPVTDIYQPAPPELPPPPSVEELPPEEPEIEDVRDPFTEAEPEPILEPEPEPVREPRAGGLAARLRDATTAAAAGAVAAAKAAAAASISMPGMGLSRREAAKESPVEETKPPAEETIAESVATESVDADHDEPAGALEDVSEAPAEPLLTEPDEEMHATEDEQASEAEPEADDQLQSDGDTPAEPEPEIEPALEPQLEPANEPEPTPEPAQEPVAPAPAAPAAPIEDGDDFQRIRAIDSDIEQKLKTRGVVYFEHIAGWSASDVRRFGQELEMPGRIDREQWVEQAQILAKGGETYYSRNRKAMLKAKAEPASETKAEPNRTGSSSASRSDAAAPATSQAATETGSQREGLSGVAAASQGRSVAEMAAAAAAAIAASSASVTRGLKPIEPISPLSKVDPKISMPARITDAIREKGSAATVEITKDNEPLPETTAEGPFDDLKRIRGIGVLIEKRLNAMGIRRYDQIANWTSGDIDRVSRMLEFKGRIERESWVEQARILASGGYTEFSRRVDRGEVDTSRET
ncbi:MAG: hypothetical protein JSR78_16285 [Proteobacteria bacterium]|nr:hypothetical protein [Pseudomonadota bacterium]